MKKKEITYLSRDGKTRIHAYEWIPDGEVVGVLQISHGMVEYVTRYDEFATFLAKKGFYVLGNDHLGHGQSVKDRKSYGFFGAKGNKWVIGDMHVLRLRTQKKFPDVPYFMLGHSMGSFLLRQYITMYGEGLAGAIIMGTGHQPRVILEVGQVLCKTIATFRGWKHKSKLVNALGIGSYNRKFEPAKTNRDWVTSDEEKLMAYVNDPLCSFDFTVNGYYQMFEGMKVLTKKASMERIPKDLPIFFVSGTNDPVGNFGKSVEKIYEKYVAAGMNDVDIKLYLEDRHEVLNEVNRLTVYEDIYLWLFENIK